MTIEPNKNVESNTKNIEDFGEFDCVKFDEPVYVEHKAKMSELLRYYAFYKEGKNIDDIRKYVKNFDEKQMENIVERGIKELPSFAPFLSLDEMEKLSYFSHEKQEEFLCQFRKSDKNYIKNFLSSVRIKKSSQYDFQFLNVGESCFEALPEKYHKRQFWSKVNDYGKTKARKFSQEWNEEKNGFDVTRLS